MSGCLPSSVPPPLHFFISGARRQGRHGWHRAFMALPFGPHPSLACTGPGGPGRTGNSARQTPGRRRDGTVREPQESHPKSYSCGAPPPPPPFPFSSLLTRARPDTLGPKRYLLKVPGPNSVLGGTRRRTRPARPRLHAVLGAGPAPRPAPTVSCRLPCRTRKPPRTVPNQPNRTDVSRSIQIRESGRNGTVCCGGADDGSSATFHFYLLFSSESTITSEPICRSERETLNAIKQSRINSALTAAPSTAARTDNYCDGPPRPAPRLTAGCSD